MSYSLSTLIRSLQYKKKIVIMKKLRVNLITLTKMLSIINVIHTIFSY